MIQIEREYIGKQLTWEEIVNLFPRRYVALDNYIENENSTTGVLVCVTKDRKEMIPTLQKYVAQGKKLRCRYTTKPTEIDGLWAE